MHGIGECAADDAGPHEVEADLQIDQQRADASGRTRARAGRPSPARCARWKSGTTSASETAAGGEHGRQPGGEIIADEAERAARRHKAAPTGRCRRRRGARARIDGSSRSDSTHMLTEVKCVGSKRSREPVPGRRNSGSSATTIGNSRIALNVTAIATSNSGAPAPSAEIRITCAGAAQTSNGRQRQPQRRQAEIVRQRADADIGAGHHQAKTEVHADAHAGEERRRANLGRCGTAASCGANLSHRRAARATAGPACGPGKSG